MNQASVFAEVQEFTMLIGKCPKCGATYASWALTSTWFQLCYRCGVDIDVRDDDTGIFFARSSYTPDEDKIKQAYFMEYPNTGTPQKNN